MTGTVFRQGRRWRGALRAVPSGHPGHDAKPTLSFGTPGLRPHGWVKRLKVFDLPVKVKNYKKTKISKSRAVKIKRQRKIKAIRDIFSSLGTVSTAGVHTEHDVCFLDKIVFGGTAKGIDTTVSPPKPAGLYQEFIMMLSDIARMLSGCCQDATRMLSGWYQDGIRCFQDAIRILFVSFRRSSVARSTNAHNLPSCPVSHSDGIYFVALLVQLRIRRVQLGIRCQPHGTLWSEVTTHFPKSFSRLFQTVSIITTCSALFHHRVIFD